MNENVDEKPRLWEIGNFHEHPVRDESELTDLLLYDTLFAWKDRVVFLAGHFPLFYDQEKAYAASNKWGAFTPYSLDLACRIARPQLDLKKEGRQYSPPVKDVKFVLLADDINYEDFGQNKEVSRHKKKKFRNAFYQSMSGPDAKLPPEFQEVLDKYEIPIDCVMRQDHGKEGRENCLFFSEKILRRNRDHQNECAKAYKGLIDSPAFDKKKDYLVAFLPDRCTGNICGRVLDENMFKEPEFAASHVAMQTDSTLLGKTDVDSIWKNWGVKYRRDNWAV